MQHFPIFLNTDGLQIAVAGGGDAALAKLRLLMKSEAQIHVYAHSPCAEIMDLANGVSVSLFNRPLAKGDLTGIGLVYAADGGVDEDARVAGLARAAGIRVNIVDNLSDSDFITPAIVDRDPVTIAIGTEGAAPVLARAIKRKLEDQLPTDLGTLARIGKLARAAVDVLPMGRLRRDFWQKFYFDDGPRALSSGGQPNVNKALSNLIREFSSKTTKGHVDLAGAGPGDPDLLTMKVRRSLDVADVVIYDNRVSDRILELARREATLIAVGSDDPSINDIMVAHAKKGARVVRLYPGDASTSRNLDVEMAALENAGLGFAVLQGLPETQPILTNNGATIVPFATTARAAPANSYQQLKERA